jgi:hypothetical protein
MNAENSRHVVDHFVKGLAAGDLDLQAEVCAPDMVVEYPQSRERFNGWANVRAHAENYPGGVPTGTGKVVGSEDQWVTTPSFTILRIEGTGDTYTLVGRANYPDGTEWQTMAWIELRGGKVAKMTTIFGAPFDPPHWRAQWAERMF